MDRRKFISLAGGTVTVLGGTAYWLSDKSNMARDGLKSANDQNQILRADEVEILFLASLAPSGHNTQPWFVQYLAPFHWVIGNDRSKWLPAVDPNQRETILSIGTFIQNLECAANSLGYACDWSLLAENNDDEKILEVKLTKKGSRNTFDTKEIKNRRTVRANFSGDALKTEDLKFLAGAEPEFIHYLPCASKESQFINEQTIEANRLQTCRDSAQEELAAWIRFSNDEAEKYRDGLTTASMEIEGVAGWIVRNFYNKDDVMKTSFRQKSLDKVKEQVAKSAGWILITSKDDSLATLLETGRRMQRLFLKVREKKIAIHPMTQILEEPATKRTLPQSIGISQTVQFILRTGYVKDYPSPVSLRRPVEWFVRH